MSFDYNQFTKAELVSFLNKYDNEFKYITKPYQIILDKKIKNIEVEIEKTLDSNTLLIEELKEEPSIEKRLGVGVELSNNHENYKRLERKREKLCKLMWE